MAVNGYQKYAAGSKTYGGGRPMPTVGPVDPTGYKERDGKYKARKEATGQHMAAIKRRLQAGQKGNTFSADWLSYPFGKMG
jgi:hypothetical protein